MNDNWSCKAFLDRLFLPFKFIFVKLVWLEQLKGLHLFLIFIISAGIYHLISLVLKVEPDWKLEIELNGTALMWSLQGIKYFDVDLRTVEGTVSWVKLPRLAKLIKCSLKSSLCLVPNLISTETCLRPSR